MTPEYFQFAYNLAAIITAVLVVVLACLFLRGK